MENEYTLPPLDKAMNVDAGFQREERACRPNEVGPQLPIKRSTILSFSSTHANMCILCRRRHRLADDINFYFSSPAAAAGLEFYCLVHGPGGYWNI